LRVAERERYYPVGLRLSDRLVVVLGGDAEAALKVQRLLPYGPDLHVIHPTVVPTIVERARTGQVRWSARAYQPGDLRGATLVIVCDPAAAAAALDEARQEGVLVNAVDRADRSDVIAMAGMTRGPVEISVHTSGASAALSRRLREDFEARYGDGLGALAAVLGELRPTVRARLADPARRRAFWLGVVDARLLARARSGNFDAERVRQEILERL
jgi:precorrin-2 dehydrogenase / sirohydrochlorin ferrochelatase